MASVRKDVATSARPDDVWAAIRDIGALHTRLVPGFVKDTRLQPNARIVTFSNGVVLREPIVTIDEENMRLVWSAVGGNTTHYNASVQVVFDSDGMTRIVWIADFLPDAVAGDIEAAMDAGAAAMRAAMDRLAGPA